MRYDAEHKEKTRERVLKVAAKAIRAQGPHRVGVAGVMAKAGLTHGGFYAHFASKDDFIAEAIGQMFVESRERALHEMGDRPPAQALAAYIDFYLSERHRDARQTGCPLTFLSADAPRLSEKSQARFAQGVADLTTRIADQLSAMGETEAQAQASSILAEMLGAVSMARAEPDRERSNAILTYSRDALRRRFHLETVS